MEKHAIDANNTINTIKAYSAIQAFMIEQKPPLSFIGGLIYAHLKSIKRIIGETEFREMLSMVLEKIIDDDQED